MTKKYSRDLRPLYLAALILAAAVLSATLFGFFTGVTVLFLGFLGMQIAHALLRMPKSGPMKHAYAIIIILAILYYVLPFLNFMIFSEYLFPVILVAAILGTLLYIGYASSRCPRCGSGGYYKKVGGDRLYTCRRCGKKWYQLERYGQLFGQLVRMRK